MDVSEAADAVGKFATFAVALAVYFSTRAQTRWSNQVSSRAAQVEDQKFRLQLLDRRIEAYQHVQRAIGQFWTEGVFRADAADALRSALGIAQFVFDPADEATIQELLQKVWQWQSSQRRVEAYNDRLDPERQARFETALEEQHALEGDLLGTFNPVLERLRESARVRTIPMLPVPTRKWWQAW